MSYPLGGTYHVPHGESNYAMFTGVLNNYMEIKQDGELAVMNAYLAELLGCDVAQVYDKLEELLNQILPKKALHEYGVKQEELAVFKRGRNAHVHTVPHSASRADYLKATALECLLGDLYLRGRRERINELFTIMMEEEHDAF